MSFLLDQPLLGSTVGERDTVGLFLREEVDVRAGTGVRL
jgi:hypothetical protein